MECCDHAISCSTGTAHPPKAQLQLFLLLVQIVICFSAAISAARVARAICRFFVISYSAAISACEKGIGFLRAGLTGHKDVNSFDAAFGGSSNCQIFHIGDDGTDDEESDHHCQSCCDEVPVSLISYSAAISVCDNGQVSYYPRLPVLKVSAECQTLVTQHNSQQWVPAWVPIQPRHSPQQAMHQPSISLDESAEVCKAYQDDLVTPLTCVSSFNAAISACEVVSEKGALLADGVQLQCGHHNSEQGLSVISFNSFNAAISACEVVTEKGALRADGDQLQCGHRDSEQGESEEMCEQGLCGHSDELREKGLSEQPVSSTSLPANVITLNAAISACDVVTEKGAQRADGDQLQCGHRDCEQGESEEIREQGLCGHSDELREKGLNIQPVSYASLPASVISSNAAISACEVVTEKGALRADGDQLQCGHRDSEQGKSEEMCEQGLYGHSDELREKSLCDQPVSSLPANVNSFNAAISACEVVTEKGVLRADGDQLQCGHCDSEQSESEEMCEQGLCGHSDELREKGLNDQPVSCASLPANVNNPNAAISACEVVTEKGALRADGDQLQCGHRDSEQDESEEMCEQGLSSHSDELREQGLCDQPVSSPPANVSSFSAAISACEVVSEKGALHASGDQLQCGHRNSEQGFSDEMREQGQCGLSDEIAEDGEETLFATTECDQLKYGHSACEKGAKKLQHQSKCLHSSATAKPSRRAKKVKTKQHGHVLHDVISSSEHCASGPCFTSEHCASGPCITSSTHSEAISACEDTPEQGAKVVSLSEAISACDKVSKKKPKAKVKGCKTRKVLPTQPREQAEEWPLLGTVKGVQWQQATSQVVESQVADAPNLPDVISSSEAISACDKEGEQWQQPFPEIVEHSFEWGIVNVINKANKLKKSSNTRRAELLRCLITLSTRGNVSLVPFKHLIKDQQIVEMLVSAGVFDM